MIVKEIMKKDVATCPPTSDLASAIQTMQQKNCGFLPVVDTHGAVIGVVTDRGACLAVADHKHQMPTHISVKDAMSQPVFSCLADENLKVVLGTMAKHQVRRLPVVDKQGHLQGVVSIDDVIEAPHRRGSPTSDEIVDALKAICAPRVLEGIPA